MLPLYAFTTVAINTAQSPHRLPARLADCNFSVFPSRVDLAAGLDSQLQKLYLQANVDGQPGLSPDELHNVRVPAADPLFAVFRLFASLQDAHTSVKVICWSPI